MSVSMPGDRCRDLAFQGSYPLSEPEELALEDYARVLTLAASAEALHGGDDPSLVTGVHVCRLDATVTHAALADVEGFAREMAARGAPGEGA